MDLQGVEEVCNFLRNRKVNEETVLKFKHDKMDAVAINYVSDLILSEDYGIESRGDLYALRAFCRNKTVIESKVEEQSEEKQEREKRKKDLVEQLVKGREERSKSGKRYLPPENKISSKPVKKRKISMGWLHYENSKYKLVRQVKGGGTRTISVDATATKKDLLEEAVSLFLTCCNEADYEVEIGNFKGEPLKEEDFDEPFTVEKYYAVHKLSRARFYLMTKDKIKAKASCSTITIDPESDSDDSLMEGVFDTSIKTDNQVAASQLIGSTSDRVLLKERQDLAFNLSLEADKQKKKENREKLQTSLEQGQQGSKDEGSLETIRAACEARVPEEPDDSEPSIKIAVRHPTIGTVRRKFKLDANMESVYDWIGSLKLQPLYFMLRFVDDKKVVYPSQPVSVAVNQVLFMEECEEPPPLDTDDLEVSFLGYGPSPNLEDTVPNQMNELDDLNVQYIEEELPDQLLESENEPGSIIEERGRAFRRMVNETIGVGQTDAAVARDYDDLLTNVQYVVARRDDILTFMLDLYEDEEVCNSSLFVSFENELGADLGGVSRDLFSCFWEKAYEAFFDGDIVKVPFIPPHKMSQAQAIFTKLGRVFSHGFLVTKTIPVRFCEVCIVAMLFGENNVTDDKLLSSFLHFVTTWEKELIMKGLNGAFKGGDEDDILSLFTRFGMRCAPSQAAEKFRCQIIDMAKSELLYKPCTLLTWMQQGIPRIHHDMVWSKFSTKMLSDLFDSLVPTMDNVVQAIACDSEDLLPEQDRMLYFLKTFVRSLDQKMLERFLHFITGAAVTSKRPIRVAFNTSSGLRLAPSASTCGNILFLSTTYESMQEFKYEFLKVLHADKSFVLSNV